MTDNKDNKPKRFEIEPGVFMVSSRGSKPDNSMKIIADKMYKEVEENFDPTLLGSYKEENKMKITKKEKYGGTEKALEIRVGICCHKIEDRLKKGILHTNLEGYHLESDTIKKVKEECEDSGWGVELKDISDQYGPATRVILS